MSSGHKRVLFSVAAVLALCCALTAAVVTALPLWIRGTVLCRTGAELVNATGAELDKFVGEVRYGLFSGHRVKQCGLGGRSTRFYFFPELQNVIPATLHVSIIFFCSVVILFSCVASGFFFFNAFGRPYETLQGPMGLYLWSATCCVSSCLVMILFGSEVKLHRLSERIANFDEVNFRYQTHSERYDRGFWLYFLVLVLHALNFLLVRVAGIHFPFLESKESDLSNGADLMY